MKTLVTNKEFLNTIKDQYEPLLESEIDSLNDYIISKTYKKNEIIHNEGNLSKNMFFVLKGSLRTFYSINGNDKTTFFHSRGDFVWSNRSCTFQIPTNQKYQALEETTLVHFYKFKTEAMFKHYPKLEHIARLSAENGLMTYQKLIASHILLSAEQRFLELMEVNREIFQKVPQKHIASYIGVSPETLSRIKRKVYSR